MSASHLVSLAFAGGMLGGCGVLSEPDPPLSQLRAAPTSLVVDDRVVPVGAEIWRNLMPSIGPRGSPLTVFLHLPGNAPALTVTRLWVLLGDQVWSGPAERDQGTTTWVARNGPEWPVGASTEVVGRIRLDSQRSVLVRVPGVVIGGAY